jgi:hypothetical protein
VIYVVNGIGLWKLLGWGSLLTIVLLVLGIIFGILGLFRQLVGFHVGLILWQLIWLAIYVWILTYMSKPHVKQALGQ